MKPLLPFFLLLFTAAHNLCAQTIIMNVQKSTNCNYELLADSSLLNNAYEISEVSISGVDNIDASIVKAQSGLTNGDNITVNKDSLDKYLYKLCEKENPNKLLSVKIRNKTEPNKIFISLIFEDSRKYKD